MIAVHRLLLDTRPWDFGLVCPSSCFGLLIDRYVGWTDSYGPDNREGRVSASRHDLVSPSSSLSQLTDISSLLAASATAAIWAVPSIIANSICFCIIGFTFGPLYPTGLMIISQTVDDDLRVGAIGLMGSLGGVGSAFWPA
jgi:MFS family permease